VRRDSATRGAGQSSPKCAWMDSAPTRRHSATLRQRSADSGVARTQLLAHSSLYRSAPIEAAGPEYLNAVAQIAPDGCARTAEQLQLIERRHGRERPFSQRAANARSRLLLYGEEIIATRG